jgi:RecA/RadA recombinase
MTAPKKRKPVTAKKESKKDTKVRVRVDPIKEYAETMKSQGIARVSYLADDDAMPNIRGRISTGSLALDRLLQNPMEPQGWAGIPLGRVTEIFGPPFIGKSTLLDCIMGQCQQAGGTSILADTEVSRDRHYVQRLGVDLSKLQYLEFERGAMYLENVMLAIYKTIDFWGEKFPDMPVVIGLDALGGTATKDELEKQLVPGEKGAQPALAARVMGSAARLFPERLRGRKIAVVILNHEYEKVGGFGGGFGQGPRMETYGGSGVRHLGSLRMKLRSSGTHIKASDGAHLGTEVLVKLVKSRLGSPATEAHVPILHGVGVENVYTLYEDLKDAKVLVVSGGWAAVNLDGDVLKFQGWQGLKAKCTENPELWPRLVNAWRNVTCPSTPTDADSAD